MAAKRKLAGNGSVLPQATRNRGKNAKDKSKSPASRMRKSSTESVRDFGLRKKLPGSSNPGTSSTDKALSPLNQGKKPPHQYRSRVSATNKANARPQHRVGPLTGENQEKQQEKQWEFAAYNKWEPPEATVDERLKQARVFLSDEDINLHRDFEKRLRDIDNYLRELAYHAVKCDITVYNEVQDMLGLHQARIDELKNQVTLSREENPFRPYSQRLTLEDLGDRAAMLRAPIQNGRLSLAVERPADHNLFIQTLRSVTPRGKELQDLENHGLQEVLLNPSLANEFLEEKESQSQYERFAVRARKRGRRRAAIQLALQRFATNHEQHYEGGWQHNVLRIPSQPLPKRPVSEFTIRAESEVDKKNMPPYVPPYRWTKRYLNFLNLQESAQISGAETRSLQELVLPLNENQPVPSEARALELIRKAILKEAHEDKPSRKITKTKDWALVAQESVTSKRKDYFAPGRWPPSSKEPSLTARKRKAIEAVEAAEKDLEAKRVHLAELDDNSDDATRLSSTKQPPEEIEPGPKVGHGALIPREIEQFDYKKDGTLLENAPDPKEKYLSDAPGFMFAETSFLEGIFSHRIGEEMIGGGLDLERGRTVPRQRKPPAITPRERFPLPRLPDDFEEHPKGPSDAASDLIEKARTDFHLKTAFIRDPAPPSTPPRPHPAQPPRTPSPDRASRRAARRAAARSGRPGFTPPAAPIFSSESSSP